MTTENLTYLGWLLAWSLPILVGQWIAFPGFLLRTARRWFPVSLKLAAYFAAADAIGIASGIWHIGTSTTVGWKLFGVLPFEEALFFVLTTLMVAQSTTLILWRFGDLKEERWPGWRDAIGRGRPMMA